MEPKATVLYQDVCDDHCLLLLLYLYLYVYARTSLFKLVDTYVL